MSAWEEFFDRFRKKPDSKAVAKTPGTVMISFVNRYLEPLDNIKYRIQCEGQLLSGSTTVSQHTITLYPRSTSKIDVFAWSRVRKEYKLIDSVTPIVGKSVLQYERMKTFKHSSETELHPIPDPLQSAPQQNKTQPKPQLPTTNDSKKGATLSADQGVTPIKGKNDNKEPEHKAERTVPGAITADQLKKIFPAADANFLEKVATELNCDLSKYKLDTILRRAHFFAQVRQEAGANLSPRQENLNYKPAVLKAKFSYYHAHPSEAEEDGRLEEIERIEKKVGKKTAKVKKKRIIHAANQEKIANKAYANRSGNGNPASGDGWNYRGRGIFQLTLRNNYKKFNEEYGVYWNDTNPDFLTNPDRVIDFPFFIRSAVWYWVHNKIYETADLGSEDSVIDTITGKINGAAKDAASERRDNFTNLSYPAFK